MIPPLRGAGRHGKLAASFEARQEKRGVQETLGWPPKRRMLAQPGQEEQSPARAYCRCVSNASFVTRWRYANSRSSLRRTYHPPSSSPQVPSGSTYSTQSSSQHAFAPSGKKLCVCSQRGNGPQIILSRNIRPGSQSVCSAIQVCVKGPMRTRSVTRDPICSMPPVVSTTRASSHGGLRRSKAPGSACQR